MIRQIDELGRIVIPISYRRKLNISTSDNLEITLKNNTIQIKKAYTKEEIYNEIARLQLMLEEIENVEPVSNSR